MNEKIKKLIITEIAKLYPGCTILETDEGVFEWLDDFDALHEECVDSRRWWDETFKVIKLGDYLLGFGSATTTGDESPYDKGWEPDFESVSIVEEKEKTVIVKYYEKKEL